MDVLLLPPPDTIVLITTIASTVKHSHTPSQQVIVLLSLCFCATGASSFVYSTVLHLEEMKVRLYA